MWEANTQIIIIYSSTALALLWAFVLAISITSIKIPNRVKKGRDGDDDESAPLKKGSYDLNLVEEIGAKISKGANAFARLSGRRSRSNLP